MKEHESIEVVVEPDFAEYRRILYERAHKTIKNLRLVLGVLLVAVILWIFNTVVIPDFDGPTHRTILLVLSIGCAVYLFVYVAFIWSIRDQAKKWTGGGEPITYRISQNGFKSSSKMLVWESPWSRFTKIIETESDLFFFVERGDFVPIPKRFVLDETILIQLRRIISSNATGSVELLS